MASLCSSFLNVSQLATGLLLIMVSLGHHDVVQAQTQTTLDTRSSVDVHNQLQACKAAMIEMDVDFDGSINRAEYINLLSAMSPSSDCDVMGDISNLLVSATFSTLFVDLACKCLEWEELATSQGGGFGTATFVFVDNADCCTEKNQHLRVPDVDTPEGYTMEVCTTILETIDQECPTSVLVTTPAPSLQPTTVVSRSPSVSPSVLPSAAPSFEVTVEIVEITPPPQGQAPDPPLPQEGGDKEEDIINTDDDNIGDDDDDDENNFRFRFILIASVAVAGCVFLIVIVIPVICISRQLHAQHHHQQLLNKVLSKGSKYGGRSFAAGDEDEDSDRSHTEIMEGDEYDDNDRDIDYGFDLEHGLRDEDEDEKFTLFTDDDHLSFDSAGGMRQGDEQGEAVQGSSTHHDDPYYSFPTTSSMSSCTVFTDGEDGHSDDDDDVVDNKIRNKTVGPLTWKQGADDDDDDMSTDDGSNGDTLTSLVSADGLSQGDGKDSHDDDKNKTVGPLTWQQGYDGDDDDMSTDDDTLTSLVSASDMRQGDEKDSIAESIERSYTSKGSSLSSHEIAINTIIEQSKNGAEWFEFNLPSDDEDDDDVSGDDDDDLFTIDNLGFDPADTAALRAIASHHSHLSLR
jgi:hypothetical protein